MTTKRLGFTDPMLVDSGETVLQLSLHLALCRAVYDLDRDVPFAIRRMGGGDPLVGHDGRTLYGTDAVLMKIVLSADDNNDNGLSARRESGLHPAEIVTVTIWDAIDPKEETDSIIDRQSLFTALNLIANLIRHKDSSGMIEDGDGESLFLWSGWDLSGDPDMVSMVSAVVDAIDAGEAATA